MTRHLVALVCCLAACAVAFGQGAATTDHPPAFKVEIDNPQVRVVRRYHAPHESVPMHSHKEGVIIYLTEVREASIDQDGTAREIRHHAGDVIWSPAHTHSFKNMADTPIEAIEIEVKSAPDGNLHSHVRSGSGKLTADAVKVSLANRR